MFFQPPALVSASLLVRVKRAVIVAAAIASQGCQTSSSATDDGLETGEIATPAVDDGYVMGDMEMPVTETPDAATPDAASDAAPSDDAGEQDAGKDAQFPHT